MYRGKIEEKTYNFYSIYSFSAYTLQYPNYTLCEISEESAVAKLVRQIYTSLYFVKLFSGYWIQKLFKYKIIAYPVFSNWDSWESCSFICSYKMSQKYTDKEHKSYQVVEILKNDMLEEITSEDSRPVSPVPEETKIKKSLFATLIKRRKHSSPKKIAAKAGSHLAINFSSESSASENELTKYELPAHSEQNQSKSPNKVKQYGFFKKIIKRTNSSSDKKSITTGDNSFGDATNCNKHDAKSFTFNFFATAYIPKCNIKLINGINELQSILHNLYHSEQHVVYLLKKYIEDKSVQKQLMEASCEYFALHYDSKCQAHILADKMWYQQIEINKMQDYHLQKRLNFLVKSNRLLESQIENLSRHCEKLAAKTNLFPKRFLHMRSFGKIYARQLIDNNRKLQKKSQTLTEVISDFEEELHKLQHQKEVLEEEKRNLRARIYHLESILEREENEREIEKSGYLLQINHHNQIFKDSLASCQCIYKDLDQYKHQLRSFEITINWPLFQFQDICLPETILQIRACVEELFLGMMSAMKNAIVVAKDVSNLRDTNARLQENLQKSTSELDNLSKKLERNFVEVDFKSLESLCRKLEKENITLKLKMETISDETHILKKEIEIKTKNLEDSRTSVNSLLAESTSFSNQLEELYLILSQLGVQELSKEFHCRQDRFNYLKLRCSQIISDHKVLLDKCNTLSNENQRLLESEETYQQDLAKFQETAFALTNENEMIKKQLINEHQTVITLQNERLKYLEEKTLLKTIFQHLKSEVSRIQHLEGTVADMNKETNRLSLIAEFNKQLGEQLKNEVEIKDQTITELRQSLEKLSHIQLDNDKEKMNLCARLSEVVSVKEKLSDCLEMELRKNVKLDESKKKLECSTKSQLKIYEEMQKNERTALKELLKDFKNLIKQRDCLVQMQEESKKSYKDLEKQFSVLKKQCESVSSEKHKMEEEFEKIVAKLKEQETQMRLQEEKNISNEVRYEKNLRKLEKLLSQLRDEKSALETSNTFLKNNAQKVQSELDQARETVVGTNNKLSSKTTEITKLENEIRNARNDLQTLSQNHGKALVEIEYLKKINDQQKHELKDTFCQVVNKDNIYLETQAMIMNKEQQITELSKEIIEKESEIRTLQQECGYLKKQVADQNVVMNNYEDRLVALQDLEICKKKLEEDLMNIQLDNKTKLLELENSRKEVESLKNQIKALLFKSETERSFYHSQANEIYLEYSEQKANIEDEIDSISSQLRSVTDNLHSEKLRFDDLSKAYEDLQANYAQIKDNYNSEVIAHKEAIIKVETLEGFMKTIISERDNLQEQIHLLLVELNEEKDAHHHVRSENNKIQLVLEQARQQYAILQKKNAALEDELKDLRAILDSSKSVTAEKALIKLEEKNVELKMAKETIESLRKELHDNQKNLGNLKEDSFKLQQQITGLEFKNCELTLQLHETQGKLETERNLCKELKAAKTPQRTPPLAPSENGEVFY